MQNSGLGAKIDFLSISCLGFADDVVLTADNPLNLQLLMNICEKWAKKNLMEFNISKCKVMVFNCPPPSSKFTINNREISVVKNYKYLGIEISSKNQTNLFTDHFKKTIEKAEKRLHCISHYGFHRDGLKPESTMKLYKLMVRPILEYGAQVLTYQKYCLQSAIDIPKSLNKLTVIENKLEHFQTQALKKLIGCPKSTPPAVVRLFTGVEPLKCRLDMLKLRYFWKLTHSNDPCIITRVFKHRKRTFLSTKNGFIHEVFNLCCKYDAINIWNGKLEGLTNPTSYIKNKILIFNLTNDLDVGRRRHCAFRDIYLSNCFSYQKSYHLVKPFINKDFFQSASARCNIVKVLLYPHVFTRKCKFCSQEFKDVLSHQLFSCINLENYRRLLRSKLALYNFPTDKLTDNKHFLKTALERKIWTKCFCEFLADIDYGSQVQK